MSEEPGFLARWSRRKRGLAEAADPAPPAPLPAEAPAPAPPEEADPAEVAAIEAVTDLEALRDLLGPQVAPGLRRVALRRLWALDPAIRDFIGPADYAWDFNAPDGVPGFATSLGGEVGRLLAQAIGTLTPPVEPAPATAEVPLPAPPLATLPEAPPVPALAEAPVAPAEAPRRRHGGAVPV